jgi:anti-sigma28 factor (negative regulator of flagellin synthesis)
MENQNTPGSTPVETNPSTETTEVKATETTAAPSTETKQELQDQLQDPSLSKEEKKEIKQKIKELTLKVDGKVIKEALPFEVDPDNKEMVDYLTKQLQMAKMSHNRSKYAKTLEDEISQFFQSLKTDPESVLSDPNIGIDLEKFAAKIIEKKIEQSKKTPEQIEKEKMAEELKALKAEREKEKEEAKKRDLERQEREAYTNYEQGIIKAIDSAKDLPKSSYVVKKFADYLHSALEKGYDLTPEDVLPLVRQEIANDIKQMFEASPDEMVENFLGKDRLNKLRKKNLERAKEGVSPLRELKDVAVEKGDQPKKKISYKEFFS